MSKDKSYKITETKYQDIVESIFDKILENGLGAIPKKEMDLFLFNTLLRHTDLKDKTNYELSLILKQSEPKIQNMKYECELKYATHSDDTFKSAFLIVLQKSKYEVDKKQVSFSIDDIFMRKTIENKLKGFGAFADSSFNASIMKINLDSFVSLLEIIYEKKDIEKIEKGLKKLVKDPDAITFKGLLKKFVESVATQAGKKTVDLIAIGLTGGTSEVPTILETAKGLFSKTVASSVEPDVAE